MQKKNISEFEDMNIEDTIFSIYKALLTPSAQSEDK